jgi:nicotinamidase/pyrazinamidase
MKILLIVDLQNDFCPGGLLAVPHGDEIVPLVNALSKHGDYAAIIASRDWHPADHISFAANHFGALPGETVQTGKGAQILWPSHCVQNSKGADFHPGLEKARIQFVVSKGIDPAIDSYSAFFDNAHAHSTGLAEYLDGLAKGRGLSRGEIELHICGLATDYCVKATALDAALLKFPTAVIVDACRAVNLKPDDEIKTLRELSRNGVHLLAARELLTRARGRELRQSRPIALAA